MELSPSWKGTSHLRISPTFYGTRRFITVFTRALHRSLSWARSIQSIPPHPISLRSILILSSYLRLGPPSGLFPYGFPTKFLYAFHFSPFMLHVLPISSSLTSNSNYTWRTVQVMTLLIMQLSPTFIPLRSKYFPQHPVLEHKVAHPYKTKLYFYTF
jgi:hypothetical protein